MKISDFVLVLIAMMIAGSIGWAASSYGHQKSDSLSQCEAEKQVLEMRVHNDESP